MVTRITHVSLFAFVYDIDLTLRLNSASVRRGAR